MSIPQEVEPGRGRRLTRRSSFPLLLGLLLGVIFMVTAGWLGGEGGGEGARDTAEQSPLGAVYNVLNTALILGSLTTGLLMLSRRRRGRLLTRRTHRVFGWTLVLLFAVDMALVTGPRGVQSVVESANVVLLSVLTGTSVFLFAKPPGLSRRWYWPVRNTHVIFAVIYAVKFFAEPLTGGKLG